MCFNLKTSIAALNMKKLSSASCLTTDHLLFKLDTKKHNYVTLSTTKNY